MNADPKTIQHIFAQAVVITDIQQRQAFIREQCAHDSELLGRVEALLAAYDEPKPFFDQPTAQLDSQSTSAPLPYTDAAQQVGSMVAGRYKLLEAIGEGGMGTVWVAEQTSPVRRKVALKLVKLGMDSRQVLARFDAERQALALMDHPNIAKVFDGGVTEQGRPYFAMEYVKGMPLTEYCDQVRLSLEERLKLFIPICQAVQHAHQKGIIHRDLKPSNVLICLYDGKPVPKVIDFGLAKAMYQPLTEQTLHTGHGLMIGTPLYMSPEQAEHNNLDVDTRTDIYSLGVMLYELLTGTTPLERAQFKQAAFGEILRLIKEVEPPKPSTRVSTDMQRASIAAQRSLKPEQLRRSIRGDLDWIVMKALDKERDRRYETANGLARDLERFLSQEAVEACPPSTVYRLRKQFQKHRAAISTIAAFLLLLCAGAVVSTWQAIRATKAERFAVTAEATARQERDKALENERQAVEAKRAESEARLAEEQARLAETQQRAEAESQRIEAVKQRDEATKKSNELVVLTEEQRRIIYVSEMNQVRIEAQRGNLARMREVLLDQLPIGGKEDLRGFEWNYWYRYLNQAQVINKFDKATIDTRGSALVTVLPSGRHVSWTQGTKTELVDLQDGTSHRLPYQLRHYVDGTRFSHTGRAVVGACLSHTFPVESYKPPGTDQGSSTSCSVIEPTGQVHTFDYPSNAFKHISALTISSDGNLVAVIGYDASHSPETPATRICVWKVDTKKLILNQVYQREINRISFSLDGEKIAAHLCHGTKRFVNEFRDVVVIVDVKTGEEISVAQHDDDIDSLFWIPGSNRVLLCTLGFSGFNRKQLMSWQTKDAVAQPVLLTKEPMPDYVNGVVSPDGGTLAITSHVRNDIRLYDTTRGDLLDTLQTDGKAIVSLTFSADGRQIIATTTTGEVLRWDLERSNDLFNLRTKPLPRLAANGYALSQDQSLLAIVLADGDVLIRTRNGIETTLKTGLPQVSLGSAQIRFSTNNRLLAILAKFATGATSTTTTKGQLEVYDLVSAKRLWQINCLIDRDRRLDGGSSIEFTSDDEKLVYVVASSSFVLDSRTGKGTVFNLREDTSSNRFALISMFRNTSNGKLHGVKLEQNSLGENTFGVYEPVSGTKVYGCSVEQAGTPTLAPDGQHCANPRPSGIEIWNLAKGERVLTTPGFLTVFSPDSKRFAAMEPNLNSKTISFSGVTIWDLASRKQLCELPLGGDTIDEARFSPDGKRLLTLEGKSASDSTGRIPRGRIWDVETGREILDLPVAEQSHYTWDLFFDASGHQIMQLLFDKATGTTGVGKTALYDASPLEPSVDNTLAADRLMAILSSKFALKREWLAEVQSRVGLKPGIRAAVLAKIEDSVAKPEQIAKLTGEIVGFSSRSPEDYQRAVVWAEELYRLESDSIRSCTLLGAAYYRTNRLDDALRILTSVQSTDAQPTSDIEQGFEGLRHLVLALVHFRMGNKREAQLLSEAAFLPSSLIREYFATSIFGEVRSLISKRIRPTAPESMPTDATLVKTASSLFSISGNTDFELAKLPKGAGHRLITYDVNQDQRLSQEEQLSALKDMYRYGLKLSSIEGQYSIESQLDFINETIREAPSYLTARFAHAWIRATCPDAKFRNAALALEEAQAICEQTKYQDATFLEALAAAYAASGDFDSATRWQSTAIGLYRENHAPAQQWFVDTQNRLGAYQEGQMCSSKMPFIMDLIVGGLSTPTLRELEVSAPYLAPDSVPRFRRIDGSGAAWSPDGTKIVRSVKSSESGRVLEWINLESAETQVVCEDGTNPLWTAEPSERIYFTRTPQGAEPMPFNQTIWQCDPKGKKLTQLMEGVNVEMLKDGSLWVIVPSTKTVPPKFIVKGYRTNQQGAWSENGLKFELQGNQSRLSPDGRLMAESLADLVIRDVASQETVQSLDLLARMLGTVVGAWSPDSRYYAYGSSSRSSTSGLWILDVTTGDNRMLADIDATNPSWSHNGRFIAADERGKDRIVIIDVSSIYKENRIGDATQRAP